MEEESVDSIESFDEHDIDELIEASAKLKVLSDLVDRLIGKGCRILIFSQSTKVLDIIERVLKERFNLERIDGKTKEKDRQIRVDQFNEEASDIDIMLISTKAGGQGLTLTGADTCIVYDPSWNPAEDAQAVDRCYRIGQRKAVQVFRLITAGTVEEKRYEKQIHKGEFYKIILIQKLHYIVLTRCRVLMILLQMVCGEPCLRIPETRLPSISRKRSYKERKYLSWEKKENANSWTS